MDTEGSVGPEAQPLGEEAGSLWDVAESMRSSTNWARAGAECMDASGSACGSVRVTSTGPSSLSSRQVPGASPGVVPELRPAGRTARHDPTLPTPRAHRCVQVLLTVLKHVHDGPHRQQRAPRPQDTRRWAQHLRRDRAAGPQAPPAFTPPHCQGGQLLGGGRLLGRHSRDR